jgi:DNA polymerase-3 subunit gamma/tau
LAQALYRKWRPHLWDEVVGQDHVVQTLKNAIRSDRIAHAYLLAGPRGTGKTTSARLLAKAVNCLAENLGDRPCDQCENCQAVNDGRFLDLIEIDAASNTSVDDIRDLRDKINFQPSKGRKKVYIIDEVHMLSTAAFNALLKTLEEPPPHAIFILATTEVHKIPATVLSRCQRHEFRRIPVRDIVSRLKIILTEEKITAEEEALILIARQSTGAMRDAISLVDQLSSTGEDITVERAQQVMGTATNHSVIDLVQAIVTRQAADGLNCIHRALDAGTDPRQFARQAVDYLRSLLLIRMGTPEQVDATQDVRQQMAQHAQALDPERLLEALRLFNSAASDNRAGWQPGLLLELALVEAIEEKKAPVQIVQAAPAVQAAVRQPSQAPEGREERSVPPPLPPASGRSSAAPLAAPQTPARQESPAAAAAVRPAETPAAQPAEMPAAAPSGGISLQDIVHNWARIRTVVKRHRSQTEGLLNSCKPVAIKDGALVLSFKTEILRQKMDVPENVELIRQAVYHVTGANLGVSCVVSTRMGSSSDAIDVPSDGLVGAALNLGGQIVQKE